ncbi:MAG TPA: PilZ domain-containing protein [Tepidisphaeraceae bacterium]|jgi:hypothetical protein|nr:PilZ domain-containing protein [Tepidisphaeraceae bacterium]
MVALLKMPRLATTEDSYSSTATSERRIFERKEMHYRVEGRRTDHTVTARRQPHLSLSLRDLSVGGLSAITDVPVAPGEGLAVFFPPQGIRSGWDAYGRVLRCDPAPLGYRIAVEFDSLPAA